MDKIDFCKCIRCGQKLSKNSIVIQRKGFVGSYCSWKCAAIESGMFQEIELTEDLINEDMESYELAGI